MEQAGIAKADMASIINDMNLYISEQQSSYHFFKGIPEAFEELAKENLIYIITSNSTPAVESFIDGSLLGVKEVLGSDKEKNKVKKIKKIIDQHNEIAITDFWFIGDTKGDILEGNEAGVNTVAVSWGWHSLELLEEAIPYQIVDTPAELVLLFNDNDIGDE